MLHCLDCLHPLDKRTLKELRLKTSMLLATGQSDHALHSLKTSEWKMNDCKCVLNFSSVLKATKPGVHTEPAEIRAFAKNENLCLDT